MKNHILFEVIVYKPSLAHLNSLRSKFQRDELLVVDNTTNNKGYGGGANLGLRQIIKEKAEWIVVMNQDITIKQDSIRKFKKFLTNSPPALIGLYSGGLDKIRWSTKLPSSEIDYISGSFIAIHRKIVKTIGYFYEPYFMYYEEVDYCNKAKNAGFPLILFKTEGIFHDDKPSLGKGTYLHNYYLARNHLLFVERRAPLSVKLHEYLRIPFTLIEALSKKDYGSLEGVIDYLFRKFGEKI